MKELADLEQVRSEETRWRILKVLDCGRPLAVTEALLWRALGDIELQTTASEVRRHLDYLQGKELVEVEKNRTQQGEMWNAKLTPAGVDVVEYSADCPPGINRPEKYWR